ncbi:hypothetical protein ACFFJY_13620 [Fictibacillus aquaticus]|uniref:Uncharacterized protein n=1 Tax=Fictibacillus aquaticus TaxID=2021314 RepID=A0A235FD60_9BACL|nr:hypothetical protein [Fictibacillus aquaticus]OYD59266.1 hypothetical protein CGZ90_05045 [Fictibacillus aquaticus]
MAMYLVDHDRHVVHRTAFIKTECEHREILKAQEEHLNNLQSVEELLERSEYHLCEHCAEKNI